LKAFVMRYPVDEGLKFPRMEVERKSVSEGS